MADIGLYGAYALTEEQITAHVGGGIGAYALGRLDPSGLTFYVSYVGRSDDDLSGRLRNWVGHYAYFMYGHLSTRKDAFDKECYMYHSFGGRGKLDNRVHPARPAGTDYPCPVYGCNELG